jgi:hypothetical protein
MLRPQFSETFTFWGVFNSKLFGFWSKYQSKSKIFTIENQKNYLKYISKTDAINSAKNVYSSVSFKPHLERKEFVSVILWESLNWKYWSLVFLVVIKGGK